MRLEKTYSLAKGAEIGPAGMMFFMEADGFKFDSKACPVKLTQPSGWSVDERAGTITYWQEQASQ